MIISILPNEFIKIKSTLLSYASYVSYISEISVLVLELPKNHPIFLILY